MDLDGKNNTEKLMNFRKVLEEEALEKKKTQDLLLRVKRDLEKIINDINYSLYNDQIIDDNNDIKR